jgi:hypothetical protein
MGPGGIAAVSAPAHFEENFDTSETVPANLVKVKNGVDVCPSINNGLIPEIHYSLPGPGGGPLQDHIVRDTDQILTSGGVDEGCFNNNETSPTPTLQSGDLGNGITFVPLT